MASLPAEATSQSQLPSEGGEDFGAENEATSLSAGSGNDFLEGFNRLDIIRQVGLMVGLAASVAIGFAVVLWTQNDSYQPIYGNMEGYDVTALMETLEVEKIDYKIEPSSGVILVTTEDLSAIRLKLAAAGITRDRGYGYESMDIDPGLGSSQFMESNRYRRSLEGELARTISSFRSVQSATVHIATPPRSVFIRNTRKATASVFITPYGGQKITDGQVMAISNLVAASIPDLSPEDVTVVDRIGNLLSKQDDNSELALAGKQFDYTRRKELALVETIGRILMPVVGINGYKAEVSVDIDFTRLEQTSESFNPETAVLRSEQTLDERRQNPQSSSGIPGALSNQPPGDATVPESQPDDDGQTDSTDSQGNSRIQSTRNFEVDRTLSHTSYDPVKINRLSVAVVLDNHPALEGAESTPWTEVELANITTLVENAVGFVENRGDRVNVINNAFAPTDFGLMDEVPIWEQPWVSKSLKQIGGGLLVILLVLGVLRPVLKNLASLGAENKELALAAAEGEFADLDLEEDSISEDTVTLSGGDDILLPGPSDGYEKQLNAIKGLIAEDPGRVAQVVKQWINQDA